MGWQLLMVYRLSSVPYRGGYVFMKLTLGLLAASIVFTMAPTSAQSMANPAATMGAQREAMVPLAYMDGVWRGTGWTILSNGEKRTVTQTERVGSFLGGSVKVIEGRGYDADGNVAFNAFGTIAYAPATKQYTLHSYAMGSVGDFAMQTTPDGYTWEIPAGPATIRYTVVIKDGTWKEVGDSIVPGKPPTRFFEMTLQRIGNTDWPAAGAIPAK